MGIKINCDMGESYGVWKMGVDEQIMPYIDLANLACGFHASDSNTMDESVKLAKEKDVIIGAHPSYEDKVGFGRRSMNCTKEEITNLVLHQLGALNAFCVKHNTKIGYVKPHGALYNDMMKNNDILEGVLEAISAFDKSLNLMILSTPRNDYYKNIAKKMNIDLLYEVFADRNYDNEGVLVSRNEANALIHDTEEVTQRIKLLNEFGYIKTLEGKKLYIQADTICVHSDSNNAVEFIKKIKDTLDGKV